MKTIIIIWLMIVALQGANKIDRIEQNTQKCLDKNTATSNTIDCIDIEAKQRDKELNQTYQKLKKMLDPKTRQALKKAQRQWIKTRDSDTKLIDQIYLSPTLSGSMYRLTKYSDFIEITHNRTIFLQSLINTIDMGNQ
jgi:uncharacterized protein YecT (DUF1311 family)